MDRLKELPDFIIHDILSFLPNKEAARTAILSKALLQAWQTYPRNLEFDQDLFGKELLRQVDSPWQLWHMPDEEMFWRSADELMKEFVGRKLQMKAFTISVREVQSDSANSLMNKLTELAADHTIEELQIQIMYKDPPPCWSFPESIVASTSLKAFRSLKKLSLNNVRLDGSLVNRLFARFPIEDLSFESCRDLKELKISSSMLVKLKVIDCDELVNPQIDAPKLQNFEFRGDLLPCFTLTAPQCSADISLGWYEYVSLEEWIHFLSSSMQLKELIIRMKDDVMEETTFQGFGKDTLRSSQLWKLEHLSLCLSASPEVYRGLLDSLLWSCKPNTLKSISVERGRSTDDNLIMHLHSRLKHCGCSSSAAECWCHGLKAVSMTDQNAQHINWEDLPALFPELDTYDSICFQLQWNQ